MNWMEEIRQLKELYDFGGLTKAQFEAERDKILANKDQLRSGSASQSPIGFKVGSYRILDNIGEGGMGTVFRGRHSNQIRAAQQGGDVAIKLMHQQYAQKNNLRERFDREASLGLKLNHSGIVRVFDLVEDQNQLALVMELVDGVPLSQKIGRQTGPIPYDRAFPLFDKILDAVLALKLHWTGYSIRYWLFAFDKILDAVLSLIEFPHSKIKESARKFTLLGAEVHKRSLVLPV